MTLEIHPIRSIPITTLSIVASFLDDRDRARTVSVCKCFHEAVVVQLWNELNRHPMCGYIVKHSSVAAFKQDKAVSKIKALSTILIVTLDRRMHSSYRLETYARYFDKMNLSKIFIYANKTNDAGLLKSIPISMLDHKAIAFGINDAIQKQNLEKAKFFLHYYNESIYSIFNASFSHGFFHLSEFILKNNRFDASAALLSALPSDAYKNLVHTIFKTGNFTPEGFTRAIEYYLRMNQIEGLNVFISYPWQTPEQLKLIRDLAMYQDIRYDANRFFPERIQTTSNCCLATYTRDINLVYRREYIRMNTPGSLNNQRFRLTGADRTDLIAQLDQEITIRFPNL